MKYAAFVYAVGEIKIADMKGRAFPSVPVGINVNVLTTFMSEEELNLIRSLSLKRTFQG
jgi:hypothetical protein